MSRFFIGQRVKLVRPVHIKNMGKTGRIFDIHEPVASMAGGEGINCRCIWDDGDTDADYTRGTHTSRLEPIVPDGHRSGDYSYTELMDRLKAGEVECV